MARKPVRTINIAAIAESLSEQSGKIFALISAAEIFLDLNPGARGADLLRKAIDECHAAVFPDRQ